VPVLRFSDSFFASEQASLFRRTDWQSVYCHGRIANPSYERKPRPLLWHKDGNGGTMNAAKLDGPPIPEKLRDWLIWLSKRALRTCTSSSVIPGLALARRPDRTARTALAEEETRFLLRSLCPASLHSSRDPKERRFFLRSGDQRPEQPFPRQSLPGRRTHRACLRVIPFAIPDFDWAGFPEELARRMLCARRPHHRLRRKPVPENRPRWR